MERMLAVLDEHALDAENADLERFYDSVRMRVEGSTTPRAASRSSSSSTTTSSPRRSRRRVDKLGIVYTPVEIVDFILRSADEVLRDALRAGPHRRGRARPRRRSPAPAPSSSGCSSSGSSSRTTWPASTRTSCTPTRSCCSPTTSPRSTSRPPTRTAIREHVEPEAAYEPFPGLVLTDTFQSYEDGDEDDLDVFPENNERLNRQRQLPITVIVGNPPYSVGQDSANDDNANEKYPTLDAAIRDTYAARSTATNKNSLYDSYIRAIKWATLRHQ